MKKLRSAVTHEAVRDPAVVERAAEAIWREKYLLSISTHEAAPPDAWATWPDINRDHYRALARAALSIPEEVEEAVRAERDRLIEALTPSGETKADYIGEFKYAVTLLDQNGEERTEQFSVPWTTIKQIMAHILDRARAKEQGK